MVGTLWYLLDFLILVGTFCYFPLLVGTWSDGQGGWRQTQDQCPPPSGPECVQQLKWPSLRIEIASLFVKSTSAINSINPQNAGASLTSKHALAAN